MTSAVRGAPEFASLSGRGRFITIALHEPPKDDLLALSDRPDAPSLPREAEVVLLDHGSGATHEVLVSVADEAIVDWRERDGVQPLATVDELGEAEELVRLDRRVQAALKLPRHHRLRESPDRRVAGGQLRPRGRGRASARALRGVRA